MTDEPENETAAQAWTSMRNLVLERYDRRPEVAAALGMSFVRAKAIRQLAKHPMTMTELATALAIDAPYTTLIINDLEERGLVTRNQHPDDRRRKVVGATELGLQAAQTVQRIQDAPPPVLANLAPEDLTNLERILRQLVG